MRRTVPIVMVAVVLAGCAWARPRFDAGNSGHNPLEVTISRENVATLRDDFRVASPGLTTPPAFVVARGHLYVEGAPNAVFDAGGGPDCSGSPRICPPQWTIDRQQIPDVIDATLHLGASAYDADGVQGCGGTPKVCTPLWHDQNFGRASAAVIDPAKLRYQRTSSAGHGGEQVGIVGYLSPKPPECSSPDFAPFCPPVWGRSVGAGVHGGIVGGPAVGDGRVFASYSPVGQPRGILWAFDGRDTTSFTALWSASLPGIGHRTIAVAGGVVVTTSQTPLGSVLAAYDAAGATNCSGSPKVCTPLWVSDVWTGSGGDAAPAIAGGVVYRAAGSQLRAYDLNGTQNCSGSPVVCQRLWVAEVGPGVTAPAVANGVVYTSATDGTVQAYDAGGFTNCSATTRVCAPLWDTNVGSAAGPVEVAIGRVYVATAAGTVRAFSLP